MIALLKTSVLSVATVLAIGSATFPAQSSGQSSDARSSSIGRYPIGERLDEVQIESPVAGFSGFGFDADILGELLIIGAPHDKNGGVPSGAAYIYRLAGSEWVLEDRLTTPDTTSDQRFGFSVTLGGSASVNLATVGAPGTAKAWVFRETGTGNWERIQELRGPVGSDYGRAVAARLGRLLVTAPLEGQSGVIHAFEWMGAAYDSATVISTNDVFHFVGNQLSFDGNRAVSTTGSFEPIPAKVYFFGHGNGEWSPPGLLATSPDVTTGLPVAIYGDHLVVSGGLFEGEDGLYVYERTGDTWANATRIPAPIEQGALCFGCSLDLTDNLLFVGSPSDSEVETFAGAVYVYTGSGSTWRQVLKVTASDRQTWGALGNDVVRSDGIHLVAGSNNSVETVYVFTLPTGLARKSGDGINSLAHLESFPNPFGSETVIQVTLPHPAASSISIYDVTGRLVERVDLGHRTSGNHRYRWVPRAVGAGVYVAVLEGASFWTRRTIVCVNS